MHRHRVNRWRSRLLRAALSFFAAIGVAEADEAAAQKAMAKAQFMLRQVTAEKTTLQQQVGDLQKQLDTLAKLLESTRTASGARHDTLTRQLAGATAHARESQAQAGIAARALQQQLRDATRHNATLQQQLDDQTGNFTLCRGNNLRLYDINRELLGKYHDKGAMDALLQKEPFTGAAAVTVENLVQDYQYKLDDLKLPPVSDQAGADPANGDHSSMSGGRATNAP